MRELLGKTNDPRSSHILVIRGFDYLSKQVYQDHFTRYPTWGCLLFPEFRQYISPKDADDFESLPCDDIHKVFNRSYASFADLPILDLVNKTFPSYDEDDDPVVPSVMDDKVTPEVIPGPTCEDSVVVSAPSYRDYEILGSSQGVSKMLLEMASSSKDELLRRSKESMIDSVINSCKRQILDKILKDSHSSYWKIMVNDAGDSYVITVELGVHRARDLDSITLAPTDDPMKPY